MKSILIFIILASLLSCKSSKRLPKNDMPTDSTSLIGIIHVNENQCPVYIEVSEALNQGISIPFTSAYPLNLKDGMKKKGLKVQFSYTTSKAMSPEGCSAEAVIYLDQINVIP